MPVFCKGLIFCAEMKSELSDSMNIQFSLKLDHEGNHVTSKCALHLPLSQGAALTAFMSLSELALLFPILSIDPLGAT